MGGGALRRIACACALVLAAPGPSPAAVSGPAPLVPGQCTPEGPLDVPRPASCQRILYRYGPLHVTPGDNLILFGPVTIEKPALDGHVVRFEPNLERADGTIPRVDVLHLHHAVWFSTAFSDPIFASGEEKTIHALPDGYGIPVRARDVWLLNYMLHNQTPVPDDVFITYEIDFIPAGSVSIRDVEPYWIDVGSFNGFNPVYNTQRGYGAVPGECSFPKEECAAFDPYGRARDGQGRAGNGVGYSVNPPEGTIVWMLGHLHPGGLRIEVDLVRPGAGRRRVFTSDAVYYDPNGPLSWDMSMEVTRPEYRLRIGPDDRLVMNSVYETARASWYEGMGIVVTFIALDDPTGPDPFETFVDPDATGVTHGHMPEAGNHGGPDRGALPAAKPVRTDRIAIAGFSYLPGQLGAPVIPTVAAGNRLEFVNLDAGAQVYHTVTACRAPCNGATGISYPVANGPVDFDSLELGIGPPGATAASNRVVYTLETAGLGTGTFTFFCRVHPFMRGAFAVE